MCTCLKVKVKSLSLCDRLFVTLWTVAHQVPPSMGFSRQEYWSGLPFPSPGDLPNPRIEPRSPALQADALTVELPGKPKNTGVSSLSLRQKIFPSQELNRGLLHCTWILYQLSYQGSPKIFTICYSKSLRVLFSHLVFNSPGIYFVCRRAISSHPLLPWRPARCPEATPE